MRPFRPASGLRPEQRHAVRLPRVGFDVQAYAHRDANTGVAEPGVFFDA